MTSEVHRLIERCFWWLVGIFGTLATSGITALVGVLWHLNSSVVMLNERVGTVVERMGGYERRDSERIESLRSVAARLQGVEQEVSFLRASCTRKKSRL